MLIEKLIFNMLAFSLFIIIFSKLIKKNDTNYISILIAEAIGIAINFIEIISGNIYGIISKILMYLLSVILPIIIILIEKAGYNFSEMISTIISKFLLLIGDKKAAKTVILNLIEKYPNSYKGHILLAKFYEKEGGLRRAIDEYVCAIDINSKDYESYYKIAELLKELGKKDEAITMLDNLVKNKPEHYEASTLLGELLSEQGRFKEAVSVYTEALKYRPADFELYYSLGIVYTRLNDFANAKEAYEKAAQINHKLYSAHYNLGQIALIEKDLDSAEKYFTECLMSELLEAKAYYQLAKIFLLKGDKDKAIIFANKAIEIDGDYLDIITKDPVFDSIRRYLSVSVDLNKDENIEKKKIKKEDEIVQKYLEDTYNLIENINDNEIRNRATAKVDDIFKREELKKTKNIEEQEKL